LNCNLSSVLLDGANFYQALDTTESSTSDSYGQAAIVTATKAVKGITSIGGFIGGALYSGANFVIGG